MAQAVAAPAHRSPAHRADARSRLKDVLQPQNHAALGLLAGALVAWLVALPSVGGNAVSAWGLLVSASPFFVVSIVLTVLGFVAAARAKSAALELAATVLLAMIVRLSIAIGTSTAFYPWTYKHIAVTQYIGATGHVDQTVDVYNNWPGLFAATAWVSKLTGVSPFGIAHWFTPCLHLGLIVGIYAFARQWGASPVVAAGAAFLFEGFNFVGQDYFSPQAVSIYLALVPLALLGTLLRQPGAGKNGYAAVAALVFAAMVVTHQLTPFWLLVVIGLMTVIRRCRVLWLLPFAAVAACGYLALHYNSVRYYGVLSPNVGTNLRTRVAGTPLSQVRASWYGSDVVYLLAFGLALLLAVMALRRRERSWAIWLLAFCPIGLLLVQGYGGEAVWRVYLFALPAICLMVAQRLVPALARSRLVLYAVTAVIAALIVDSAQTTFVTWPAYRVSAKEVAVVSKVQSEAPLDSIIAPLSTGAVNQLTSSYVDRYRIDHNYGSSILGTTKLSNTFTTRADYERFVGFLVSTRKPNRPFYVIISSRLDDYAWQYGQVARGTLGNLRKAMTADPRWRVVAANSDAVAFRLVG